MDDAGKEKSFSVRDAVLNAWGHLRGLPSLMLMYTRWGDWGGWKAGYAHAVLPWYAILASAFVLAPCCIFVQCYGPVAVYWEWPEWPLALTAKVENVISPFVEKRTTWYAWLPPDSGDPQELGMHYRADLLTRDPETKAYINRPRMYNRSFGATAHG